MSYLQPADPGVGLAVNLAHVAALRDAGRSGQPDLRDIARMAHEAGAAKVVLPGHLQDTEIREISALVPVRLALDGGGQWLARVVDLRPLQVSFDGSNEEVIEALTAAGIDAVPVLDADPHAIEAAVHDGARAIELRAWRYAAGEEGAVQDLRDAAAHAASLGLRVTIGQGLDYANAAAMAALPDVSEVHIGHAIAARAMVSGWAQAVIEMQALLVRARLAGMTGMTGRPA